MKEGFKQFRERIRAADAASEQEQPKQPAADIAVSKPAPCIPIPTHCRHWGASLAPPPPIELQLQALANIHAGYPKIFHFTAIELADLGARLKEGDEIDLARIFYSSVIVRRADGRIEELHRRQG